MVFWGEAGTLYIVLMSGVLGRSGYTIYSINAWCSGEKRVHCIQYQCVVFWGEAGTLYTVLMRGVLVRSGCTIYSINAWCSGEKRVHYIQY